MIRLILHQIWNQRNQNCWVWIELTLLSVFLWLAIDPLFTMLCITQVPRGYELDNLYCLNTRFDWSKRVRYIGNFAPQMDNLLTQLSRHPMVDEVCVCDVNCFVGRSGRESQLFFHSDKEALQYVEAGDQEKKGYDSWAEIVTIPVYKGLEKWADLTAMLRLRDPQTGKLIHCRTDASAQDVVYVSSKMARDFYGTHLAQDSALYYLATVNPGEQPRSIGRRVEAVCGDVKMRDYETPTRVVFLPQQTMYVSVVPLLRLKDGVDEADFMASFERDVLPKCPIDNVRHYSLERISRKAEKATEQSGAFNVIRLRAAMGFFGLLCVFLGMSGLFWVRCNDRRQDMGVMRAMGATRKTVMCQMMTEGTMLLTLAFLPALVYLTWHVYANGYDMGTLENAFTVTGDKHYWFNRPWPHVLAVTALTYLTMLAVTLLATWLPVQRAVRVEPCDALRDE